MTEDIKTKTIAAIKGEFSKYRDDKELWAALPKYHSLLLFGTGGSKYFLTPSGKFVREDEGIFMVCAEEGPFDLSLENVAESLYNYLPPEFQTPAKAVSVLNTSEMGGSLGETVRKFKAAYAANPEAATRRVHESMHNYI